MFFAPVVYEHAAALIGKTPWEVSRDPELLYLAHREAYLTYRHSPVVPVIDIYNIEAEAWGAVVDKAGGNTIPAITSYILADISDIRYLEFSGHAPLRTILAVEVANRLRDEFSEIVITIPLSGSFSIAANLLGYENLLMALMSDAADVVDLIAPIVEGQARIAKFVRDHGFDITLFETGAAPPMMSPDLFSTSALHLLKSLCDSVKSDSGSVPPVIIGGDTLPILDDILSTGTKFIICPAETDQKVFVEKMRSVTDVTVRVNMNPGILSSGSPAEIRAEVDRILDLIDGMPNACIGTGPLPYETDPQTVLSIRDYIATRHPEKFP